MLLVEFDGDDDATLLREARGTGELMADLGHPGQVVRRQMPHSRPASPRCAKPG